MLHQTIHVRDLWDMDEQKVCHEYYRGYESKDVWDENRPWEDYRSWECKWGDERVVSERATWWEPPLMYLNRAINRGNKRTTKP